MTTIIEGFGWSSLVLGVILVLMLFWQHGEEIFNWMLTLTTIDLTKVIGVVFAVVLVLYVSGRLAQWWESHEGQRLPEQRQLDQGSHVKGHSR